MRTPSQTIYTQKVDYTVRIYQEMVVAAPPPQPPRPSSRCAPFLSPYRHPLNLRGKTVPSRLRRVSPGRHTFYPMLPQGVPTVLRKQQEYCLDNRAEPPAKQFGNPSNHTASSAFPRHFPDTCRDMQRTHACSTRSLQRSTTAVYK